MLENNIIGQVLKFKYLHANIVNYTNLKEEIFDKIGRANRLATYLTENIWKNKYLRTDAKV